MQVILQKKQMLSNSQIIEIPTLKRYFTEENSS